MQDAEDKMTEGYKTIIKQGVRDTAAALADTITVLEPRIIHAAEWTARTLSRSGRIFFFGNGGSAADSQHLAAEFVNRFKINRRPLPAIALTTDTSIITAIANDFHFDQIFSKQVQALAKPGDIAVGISTSGTSPNVIAGLRAARDLGAGTIGLTGQHTSSMEEICDIVLGVQSNNTPRIQEVHIFIGHMICEIAEQILFAKAERS